MNRARQGLRNLLEMPESLSLLREVEKAKAREKARERERVRELLR
jgi:hypothetical protein